MTQQINIKQPDTNIGKSFQDCLCEECKLKVIEATKKIKPWDMLNPKHISDKFARLLCDSCEQEVYSKLKKQGGIRL